jgi:hypothetical protein
MTKPVPPRIESPKSFIAVGTREFIILGIGAVVVLLVVILKIGFIAKVGIAVLVVGLGLSAAFGRDRRTGKTIEQYLFNLLRYYSRARFRQRGAMPSRTRTQPEPAQEDSDLVPDKGRKRARAWSSPRGLRVRPLPLGPGLFFAVLSFSFLGMLLAWIWLGGLAEIQLWFGRTRF